MSKIFWLMVLGIFSLSCKEYVEKPEIKFYFIIPTYNNASRCIANIESVVQQTVKNWIAYIIDDNSTDGTQEILKAFIRNNNLSEKVILISNTERRLALENLYVTIHTYCEDESVCILLDGDDELMNCHVLERILLEYQDPHTWLTYGQFINIPGGGLGLCRALPLNVITHVRFREHDWVTSHLRTFKAWLFKQIKLTDLLDDDGRPYRVAWDLALMFPMLEMASRGHIRFIPDILYKYIRHNNNDYMHSYQEILATGKKIRAKKKYAPLTQPIVKPAQEKSLVADIIIFSYDRPLQLFSFLESLEKYATAFGKVTIICKASSTAFQNGYAIVQQKFKYVHFVYQSEQAQKTDFKPLLIKAVNESQASYILFGVDDIILKDYVNISDCIHALNQTDAYGFYLRLGCNITYCYAENKNQAVPIRMKFNNMGVWNFRNGVGDWDYPCNVDMTLYRKTDVLQAVTQLHYNSPNTFESVWSSCNLTPHHRIGICFLTSKIVNIPLNLVQTDWNNRNMQGYSCHELLDKVNRNLKFDITPLHQIQNKSPHEEYVLPFVQRN